MSAQPTIFSFLFCIDLDQIINQLYLDTNAKYFTNRLSSEYAARTGARNLDYAKWKYSVDCDMEGLLTSDKFEEITSEISVWLDNCLKQDKQSE